MVIVSGGNGDNKHFKPSPGIVGSMVGSVVGPSVGSWVGSVVIEYGK